MSDRYQVSIAAPTYDVSGHVLLRCEPTNSDLHAIERRVQRIKLLPESGAGVWVGDNGYFAGDRTLKINVKQPTQAEIDALFHLTKNYGEVVVVTSGGAFMGAIRRTYMQSGSLRAEIWIKSAA